MPVKSPVEGESDIKERLATLKVTVLAGGVGGAKLADGVARHVPAENLTIIVNTGDDFQHLGLTVCPDLDTVMYTLAGAANSETGWGRSGESWRTMDEMNRLGGPAWFALGDLDLATHLIRSHRLSAGHTLTEVTGHLCQRFGIDVELLPMSDQPTPTTIISDQGELAFQTWFVERRWQPAVRRIVLPEDVRATPQVTAALAKTHILIIAPSNPFVSIDPILNTYPIREMVNDLPDIVVAVSPIIAGKAVNGPAAKMMDELGLPVTSAAVADYYGPLLDVFVHDEIDDKAPMPGDLLSLQTDTLMHDQTNRGRLAGEILAICTELLGR